MGPNNKLNVALYLRVSTDDQNTDIQRQELISFCENKKWNVKEVFEDKGFTGSNMKRPALKRLLSVEENTFDLVMVWKFDRFARSLNELLSMLKTLEAKNIKFMSLKDNVDLTTPHGRLMMHLLGAFAEFEASMIRERVKAGMLYAKKYGTSTGNPIGKPPEISTKIKKEIFIKKFKGIPVEKIAKEYDLSKSGVYKILTEQKATLN